MKQIRSTLIILSVCTLAFSSCKKSGDKPSDSIGISLKFNGTAKSSTTPIASYYPAENSLQVEGIFNGTEAVSLMIENIKTGTFDVASDAVVASYSTTADFNNTYLGSTGSVNITSFTSDQVSGTFQFTGTNPANATGTVTEGKFTAKIIKIQQP